jgi:hypothetical protein
MSACGSRIQVATDFDKVELVSINYGQTIQDGDLAALVVRFFDTGNMISVRVDKPAGTSGEKCLSRW